MLKIVTLPLYKMEPDGKLPVFHVEGYREFGGFDWTRKKTAEQIAEEIRREKYLKFKRFCEKAIDFCLKLEIVLVLLLAISFTMLACLPTIETLCEKSKVMHQASVMIEDHGDFQGAVDLLMENNMDVPSMWLEQIANNALPRH